MATLGRGRHQRSSTEHRRRQHGIDVAPDRNRSARQAPTGSIRRATENDGLAMDAMYSAGTTRRVSNPRSHSRSWCARPFHSWPHGDEQARAPVSSSYLDWTWPSTRPDSVPLQPYKSRRAAADHKAVRPSRRCHGRSQESPTGRSRATARAAQTRGYGSCCGWRTRPGFRGRQYVHGQGHPCRTRISNSQVYDGPAAAKTTSTTP